MGRDLKRFCIVSVILLLVSAAVILLAGRTYEVRFSFDQGEDYSLILENETGEAEILEEKIEGNRVIIKSTS